MNRRTTLALATVLVVATVAAPLGAAAVSSTSTGSQSDAETDRAAASTDGNESIAPGEHFAGVVGTQQAELGGEVSERAFGVRIANAETNETKAAVVAEQFAESERRLEELESRLEALNESREAGEISEGRYRAEVATTVAEMTVLERRLEEVRRTAAELPEAAFADREIDVESIRALRDRAGDRGGPETAAIAREIAGDGRAIGADSDPGVPSGAGDGDEGDDGDDSDGSES